MDFKETLFRRMLVKNHRDDRDEERSLMAVTLTVTKEQNGYALWYQGPTVWRPRIIAWSQYGKDDVIAYAATVPLTIARANAEEAVCNYDVISLDKFALDPIVVPETP